MERVSRTRLGFAILVAACCTAALPRAMTLGQPPVSDSPSERATRDEADVPNLSGPIRVAKLLWKTNRQAAADALTKTIELSVERGLVLELSEALQTLADLAREVASTGDPADPRYAPSLAAIAILSPGSSSGEFQETILSLEENAKRRLLLKVWFALDGESAQAYLGQAIVGGNEEPDWISIVVAEALSHDSRSATSTILDNWQLLPQSIRVTAIEPMTNNIDSMLQLVAAVKSGSVDRNLVNANQLRKWVQSAHQQLPADIESVWGHVRESDDRARQEISAKTLALARSGVQGSASRGEAVFERVCSQCHQFRGKGFQVGPDITANGRGNLEQLVSNMLDPSLVIGAAFQAQTVLTVDGEVVSGIVVADNDRFLRLKVQGGKTVEFDKRDDIEDVQRSEKSLMPEGLESQTTQQELLDLLAYLCLLKPLGEPDNELIPGTPEDFIQP